MKRNLHFYTLLFVLFISTQNIKAQTAGDYKTFGAGNWATAANWSRYNGTTWVNPAPAAPSSTDGVITVDHGMTVNTTITIDQTTISSSGSVELLTSGAITVANGPDAIDLNVYGTYKRTATATNLTPTGNVTFQSGSYYIHNASGGTLPTCTWDAASNLQIDVTLANNEFTESFGNVIFNGSADCNLATGAFTRTIQGNLTISSTGTIGLSSSTTNAATLTINGNLIINANGSLILDRPTAANGTSLTKKIIVKGNFEQSTGTLNFSNNTSTTISAPPSRIAEIDVEGNFIHTGGTITETASDADFTSRFNMTKTTGTQNIESTGFSNGASNIINFLAGNANAKSVVATGKTFTQAANTTFTVSAGTSTPDLDIDGTLINQGTTSWTVNGTWAVNNNGTYVHNTLAGISTPLNSATLNTGSNFIYRGSSTLNTPVSSSGRTYYNLAYESTSGTYAPTFSAGSSALTVNGTLRVGDGSANATNLSQGAFTGTLNFNGDINITQSSTLSCNSFTLAADKILTLSNASANSLSAASASQTFTLNGITKEVNTNGFSGASTRAISNTNSPTITLGSAATVEFNGTSNQPTSGLPSTVPNVTINNNAGVTLSAGLDVSTSLALTAGLFTIGANNLTFGTSATISGTPSSTKMVVATSTGEFRKNYAGTGSFLFPVGDNTGTAEYSPVTLNFTAGTFSAAYAGVRVDNSKHTNNSSITDFLNRFWTVTTSGITSPTCDVTLVYADGDVNGTESNIFGGVKNGSVWVCMDGVAVSTNTINKSITNFYDGVFTGGDATVMVCTVCINPTNGGSIGNAQSYTCGSFDPAAITNTAAPTGHTGTLEYQWQLSTTSNSSGFSDISGAISDTYDPASISQTTWYKRLSRVDCKSNWTGAAESNVVEMTVSCVNPTSGGTIGNAQSNCGSFNPTTITNTADASGTSCTIEYQWQSSTTSNASGFSDISGATSSTYDPSTITQTTWFKRIARSICRLDWVGVVESNVIEMTIDVAPSITTQPGSPAAVCAGTGNRTFTVAAIGSGTLTYQWQEFISGWNDVTNGGVYSGATTVTLTITNPTAGMNGNRYRCVVSGTCSPIATSDGNATLTVNDVPLKAVIPFPGDGSINIVLDPDLNWTDGGNAATYDVYFGTSSPGSFIGNQASASYTPATLSNSTLYYWRINSVNSCGTTTGDIWSFTTEPVTFNPGFENNVGTANGWIKDASGNIAVTIGTAPSTAAVRTGNRRLNVTVTTTNERYVQHVGYPVVIPGSGTNYIHAIGYIRSADNADLGRVSAISTDGGTAVNGSLSATTSGSWVRFTASGTATNGRTYIPRIGVDGDNDAGGDTYGFEDVIIYTTTLSSGVDVTAPNVATGLCINSVGNNNVITWTDGTDNATQTSGINGVMILRAPAGTSLPTLNNQGYYSTDSKIGPNTINGWTVLSNNIAPGTQTYTDNNSAGTPFIYAVYMRDKAYNYSAAASFTTANGGSDQTLACGATTATMAGTAAPGGYTGTWTLVSGSGTITSPNSATTTITGITSNSIFKWSVTNGSGCSTFDYVNVYSSILPDGYPLDDTVYNETGTASFGTSPTFTAGVTYQWVVYNGTTWSDVVNGGVYSGATDTVLIINNPPFSMNGYKYFCKLMRSPCDLTQTLQATLSVLPLTIFSNTTTKACGTDFGSSFGTFTRNITVSGLPTPLNNTGGKYVLQQIDIKLGSSSCKKNLSTYDFRLTAPDGTNIDFITDLTTTSTNVWADLHFRDQPSLEKIREYSNTVQGSYYPYGIGYYAVDGDNSFQSTFNGKSPNGTWVLSIKESVSTGNEISFEGVKLYFGPAFVNNVVTTVDANNDCVSATCLDTKSKIVGTNNYYPQSDPNYPGNTVSGACDWNAANNNSTWFYFIASATTAYISVSGNTNQTAGSDDTQPIVLSQTGDCTGSFSVPTGGCPNDETRNNTAYLSANGGGITTSGNIYVNGIAANTEFNLSGLTVGQKYYLLVDGNGGISSTFYLEGLNGCAVCNTLLPIELLYFKTTCENNGELIYWATASELNNDYFDIEVSTDSRNWEKIATINGSGNSNNVKEYSWKNNKPISGIKYYRIKQVDFNGKYTYSYIISSTCHFEDDSNFLVYVNQNNEEVIIYGNNGAEEDYTLFDNLGRVIIKGFIHDKISNINIQQLQKGVYILKLGNESIKTFKIVKQ
ncbi:MAG: T9SS type A sorting domain-containing protein [Sphingobacteriales bacterium]|nr:T9SS type A sorting domain-containing protein [Sphingobacteriales bacterium]